MKTIRVEIASLVLTDVPPSEVDAVVASVRSELASRMAEPAVTRATGANRNARVMSPVESIATAADGPAIGSAVADRIATTIRDGPG